MGISDGQPVDAANSNPAWLDANADDTAIGRIDFANTNPASGPSVFNIQREINSLNSYTGRVSGSVYNANPAWTNNQIGVSTDSVFTRVNAITGKFDGTTGHKHTGSTGDGPKIDDSGVTTPHQGFPQEAIALTGVTGGSTNVSTEFLTKSPSTGSAVKGVPSTAPYNKVFLKNTDTDDFYDDAFGNRVYGRLTNSGGLGGTWTLTYYVLIATVETAYSFIGSNNVSLFYQELFHPLEATRPVYSQEFYIPSDNATTDVVDASATQRGLVSTGVQTFAGVKTFNAAPILDSLTATRPLKIDGSKQIISTQIDLASTNDITGVLAETHGGTNQSTYTLGDILYASAANLLSKLLGNTTTTRKFLRQTGNGTISSAPVWDTIVAADLPVASATTDGIVNQVAQSLAGEKEFIDGIAVGSQDVASAATITALSSTKSEVRITGATATALQGITAPASSKSKLLILLNVSSATITVQNENAGATAANRIKTTDAADLSVAAGSSVIFIYDTTQSRWIVLSSGSGGSSASGVFKEAVRAASPTNLNLASMPAAVDGVTLNSGERFAAPNQTTGSQNGIYIFNGAAAAATRSTDFDASNEIFRGLSFYVAEGTTYQHDILVLKTAGPYTIGTTSLTFVQYRKWNKENLTLNGTDITNQYKDLAFEAVPSSLQISISGNPQIDGVDYTSSVVGGVTRITFSGDLVTTGDSALISGDIINAQYQVRA
jgi:hypothetical protein